MLTRLRLTDFKSFAEDTFVLDAFTLLIGSNASGKSNVRDALRILHGVGRGYTLAEILGEKWADGGVRVWNGIRGGARQAVRYGAAEPCFMIEADFTVPDATSTQKLVPMTYRLSVRIDGAHPSIASEALLQNGTRIYDTHPDGSALGSGPTYDTIKARVHSVRAGRPPEVPFRIDRPILTQMLDPHAQTRKATREAARLAQSYLGQMRFLDLDPDAARRASPRGITTLGDRGENLSSVLAALSEDDTARDVLTSWIRALTPMDATGLRIEEDLNGNALAVLIEGNGQHTPLSSASDGTVRFLAMVAAMLHDDNPRTLFFEELENGIHPHRVNLLLDLIETSVRENSAQVIATSHSPQLLEHGYRAENARPILIARSATGTSSAWDVKAQPAMSDVIAHDDLSDLMSDGWFEDFAELTAETQDTDAS